MTEVVSSAVISALDNFTPRQTGENGSVEYTWSNNYQERILQLSFQLTRTNDKTKLISLIQKFDEILSELKRHHDSNKEQVVDYISIIVRMIGQTRDIIDGKGEYMLAYNLLNVLNDYYPELAKFTLETFVTSSSPNEHPYGSWKDVKGIHHVYTVENNKLEDSSLMSSNTLVQHAKQLLINQLRQDSTTDKDSPSLAAKWTPREKSKHHELFTELAVSYFSEYIESAKTDESKRKAILKAKTEFRKLISSINKKLDTVQIKQCSKNWSEIEPHKQTSITYNKQSKAFLNLNKNGTVRSNDEDRIICANHFKSYIEKAKKGEVEIKGGRVGLNDFTKKALELINLNRKNSDEASLLNAQWANNSSKTGQLGKMIAMVDVSGSMYGDPLHAAIALGIRVAEKSMLGKRVMTFSTEPTWVNLDGCNDFIEMVDVVRKSAWQMMTNFDAALNMILDAIVDNKLKPEDVEDMVLVVFSDMQIDCADCNTRGDQIATMMERIDNKYATCGTKLWGKPFKTPHILFWNLRSTSGFPCLSTKPNASMMSGFSPALLNTFCEEGMESLQSCTPWSIFLKTLDNPRYEKLDKHVREYFSSI